MSALEFLDRMNLVYNDAKFFTLIGYKCDIDLSIKSDTCELTVYCNTLKDANFVIDSSKAHFCLNTYDGFYTVVLS